jgi:hypothetical protein
MGLIDTPEMQELQRAIDLCGGSRRELARRVSKHVRCSSQRIDNWLQRDHNVPITMAPFVAAAVDGEVNVRVLCPDYAGWDQLAMLLAGGERERASRRKARKV